jgi:hypothetical protein
VEWLPLYAVKGSVALVSLMIVFVLLLVLCLKLFGDCRNGTLAVEILQI